MSRIVPKDRNKTCTQGNIGKVLEISHNLRSKTDEGADRTVANVNKAMKAGRKKFSNDQVTPGKEEAKKNLMKGCNNNATLAKSIIQPKSVQTKRKYTSKVCDEKRKKSKAK